MYNPSDIESKWSKKWEKRNLYAAKDFDIKPKKYVLVEFPFPSGDGLHVGHVRGYTALDAISRKWRMEGYNVLYPIGYDAFGLPTENYAIKTGKHPAEITQCNTDNFRKQLKNLGLSFDWSREINTTDPKYYRWTQWIFLKMLERGLAYQAKMPINWCPKCKVGLANEEVVNGKCDFCKTEVEKREKKQWLLKITAYADRLVNDLDKVDYSEKIKTQQINWIGRSGGATVKFSICNFKLSISVFTTRVDTIFGVTSLILAPEHELVKKITSSEQKQKVEEYIKTSRKKSELQRTDLEKEKTGVFTGAYAINPLNNARIPIWISDYVVASYGGGALMLVPAHDERDYEFAKKYGVGIKEVISGGDISKSAFTEYGTLVNSGQFNGLKSGEAIEKITIWLEKNKLGKKAVNYHLRDWVFSRQHYWGEPIPVIHCEKCGAVPVDEKDLPVKLPYVKDYKPTNTGESPLASIEEWVNVKCPKCKGRAKRETDTMPNWAGSNWYYLAYLMRGISDFQPPISKYKSVFEYWMPVDLYNGGMEHTTLHLLYSRFVYKFLYDIGAVPTNEPYNKRRSHGMVLAADGRKMSKSFGNVVNPDEVIKEYGADSLRLYEMFMGPYEEAISWSTEGLKGCYRFLNKVFVLFNDKKKIGRNTTEDLIRKMNYTVKKVNDDLENMKFNTAVASMMELVNTWAEGENVLSEKDAENFLKILAPFCPHIAEELFNKLHPKKSKEQTIFNEKWPKYDDKLIRKGTIELVIQINGRVRDKVEVSADISQREAEKLVLNRDKIKIWLKNQKPKAIIFVKGKLINIVI